MDEPVRPIL